MSMVHVVTISPFHVSAAAERPALLVFFSHSVAAARPSVLTVLSSYL